MIEHDRDTFCARFGWPADRQQFPYCIGHRGASGHLTENTLASFALAADLGADMWELDTQLTHDGVVMVSHDDHLQRVFGIDRKISQMTAAELVALGTDVPSFSEVAALARQRGTGLYVELKAPGTGPLCWQHLLDEGQNFAAFGSFDVVQVRALRDAGCKFPLSVLVRAGDDPHDLGDRSGADILHLCWERAGERPQDLVTPALLQRAFDDGRQVVLWHEERRDVLRDIMALPVLGICTDLPDLMRSAASRERGRGR
ncbi:MAG: glycerophosphodiester phosphodiesterase [Cypionkella sp.]